LFPCIAFSKTTAGLRRGATEGGSNRPQWGRQGITPQIDAGGNDFAVLGTILSGRACGETAPARQVNALLTPRVACWHAACTTSGVEISDEGFAVVPPSERVIVIADIIERYVTEHPRAADTAKGICEWWVTGQGYTGSIVDVQNALDHLVQLGRLSRTVLADGTVIYASAGLAR
jgi:hypothetical protein